MAYLPAPLAAAPALRADLLRLHLPRWDHLSVHRWSLGPLVSCPDLVMLRRLRKGLNSCDVAPQIIKLRAWRAAAPAREAELLRRLGAVGGYQAGPGGSACAMG